MENDNVNNVVCYHPDELEEFQKDLTLKNEIKLSMEGLNVGSVNDIFTYYGEIEYVVSRSTKLFGINGEEEETIDEYFPDGTSRVIEPKEYAVVLIEKVDWDSEEKKITRNDTLYIYCPISDIHFPEPDRFDGIYNQLKEEGVIDGNEL